MKYKWVIDLISGDMRGYKNLYVSENSNPDDEVRINLMSQI